jgi:hypothetical protein
VEERAQKACECLAEKWCCEASEEQWEIEAIEKMEKQACYVTGNNLPIFTSPLEVALTHGT